MTLQQLEYVIALHTHGQFSTAAEHCFVSQPSLSAMIKKLEDELGVILFDRRKQPVTATAIGEQVIAQARIVLREAEALRQIVQSQQEIPSGTLKIGIIPTIAPYLLPLFVEDFSVRYPAIQLEVYENTTDNIERMLKQGIVDACIIATTPSDSRWATYPLYNEEFVVYAPHESSILAKNYLIADDIDPQKVVLMEEGHCIRDQVINLCECKFSNDDFTIDKEYATQLRRKVEVFKSATKTKKAVWLTFITSYGLQTNAYSNELVQKSLTAEALFEA